MEKIRKSFCSSCGAPIVWGRTAKGKSMPLDYNPIKGFTFDALILVPKEIYISHFASCPNADKHRKKKS